MKLNPVETCTPSYPTRSRRRSSVTWLRRAAIAAGASTMMWLGAGCDGPPYRIGGAMPPPEYDTACGAEAPADTEMIGVPGSHFGALCDSGQPHWAKFELQLNSPLRFSFSSGGEYVVAQIQDAEGLVVDELRPEDDSIELVLPPGMYYVAFVFAEGEEGYEGYMYGSFSFQIEFAEAD